MKIVHLISSLQLGGAETALCNLLEQLQQYGDEHHVIYFYDGPLAERIRALNIPLYHVTGLVRGYDVYGIWQVHQLIKKLKPDILHTALWTANQVSRLLGWWHNIPTINELHGDVAHEGWLRNSVDRFTVGLPSALVAVSDSVLESHDTAILRYLSATKKNRVQARCMVIRNGISVATLMNKIENNPLSRLEIGLTAGDIVFGSIGRLEPIKSYHLLLQAVALLKMQVSPEFAARIKVCLVGDGSQRVFLEQEAIRLGLAKSVVFAGMRVDAYRFYPLFDCFVLSSQSEGLSIALLEAMAAGLPVVTTHNGARHDAITSGINGYLALVNDVPHLVGCLASVLFLFNDSVALQRVFCANKQAVLACFSLEKTAEKYQDLYHKLLAS